MRKQRIWQRIENSGGNLCITSNPRSGKLGMVNEDDDHDHDICITATATNLQSGVKVIENRKCVQLTDDLREIE